MIYDISFVKLLLPIVLLLCNLAVLCTVSKMHSKKNNSNIVKYYYNLKYTFYLNFIVIYFCDAKLNFQHSILFQRSSSVTWSFGNNSDMLIFSIYSHQCWKPFLWKLWYNFSISQILWWTGSLKLQHLFEIYIYCSIINACTVTFDQQTWLNTVMCRL